MRTFLWTVRLFAPVLHWHTAPHCHMGMSWANAREMADRIVQDRTRMS